MSRKKLLLARAINQALKKGKDASSVVPAKASGKGKLTYEFYGKKAKNGTPTPCTKSAGTRFSKRFQDLAPKK